MPDYLITPKAPLVFRDAKPFGSSEEMAIAETIPFPLPSTIAGAIRTAWAENQETRYDYTNNAEKLIKKRVLGPLLTRTNIKTKTTEVLYPTPADSLCLNDDDSHKKGKTIHHLYPDIIQEKYAGTDLPDKLLPVFLSTNSQAKPAKDAPKYWTQKAMICWLIDPAQKINVNQQISALPIETRTHVGIDYQTKSNLKSHLFHTSGLDFYQPQKQREQPPKKEQLGWQEYQYGLLSWFQEEMPDSYRTIGGEARLAQIQQQKLWPDCPQELRKAYIKSTSFRLILTTPAIFNNGYLPGWLDSEFKGKLGNIQVQLRAVSIARWQAGTSWDMADPKSKKGKGMRSVKRLAPAGSPNPNPQIAIQGSFLFSIEGYPKLVNYTLELLIKVLQNRGIGGKTSTGYGLFKVNEKQQKEFGKQKDTLLEDSLPSEKQLAHKVNKLSLDDLPILLGKSRNKTRKELGEENWLAYLDMVKDKFQDEIKTWDSNKTAKPNQVKAYKTIFSK